MTNDSVTRVTRSADLTSILGFTESLVTCGCGGDALVTLVQRKYYSIYLIFTKPLGEEACCQKSLGRRPGSPPESHEPLSRLTRPRIPEIGFRPLPPRNHNKHAAARPSDAYIICDVPHRPLGLLEREDVWGLV
jgi:hypothetical protein